MNIVVINGAGGVGKDTFVEFCAKYGAVNDIVVHNLSTITGVKTIASTIGWGGQKTPTDRKFLSDLKDLLTDYNDYPIKSVVSAVENIQDGYNGLFKHIYKDYMIFIHCREPKEIEKLVNVYKGKCDISTLLIKRDTGEEYINHADLEVENYNYDFVINNDKDLAHLEKESENFVNNFFNFNN